MNKFDVSLSLSGQGEFQEFSSIGATSSYQRYYRPQGKVAFSEALGRSPPGCRPPPQADPSGGRPPW